MFGGLLRYLRTYPYALIAPLMLQIPDPDSGEPRRLRADDLARMDDERLGALVRLCFRPWAINLQRYTADEGGRSEEHTSELQSLMRNSYAVLCLNKKTNTHTV